MATVESARALDAATKDEIKNLLSSKTNASDQDINVLLRESIDQALIGGFRLRTPTAMLDATIAKKLNDLRAKKI